jgi:tellurite resistance protein TerC
VGETLIVHFHWVLYVFSAVLVYTGIKMLVTKDEEEGDFKESKVYKFISKTFRITKKLHGERFIVECGNKYYMTPLFFALIVIETMDVIFALDSITAIFLITQDVFVVYTSNIFAILGLRALYFLLEAVVHKFKYLKPALAIILVFIGLKIFVPKLFGFELEAVHSLSVTFGLLFGGIVFSMIKDKKA